MLKGCMKGRICGMRSLTTAVEALEARKMFAGYRITDLGHIQPSSIDEAGYVVGSTNEGIGVGGQPIVVSPDGGITKLTQPNGTTGSAVGRNAAGDVLVNTTSTLYSDLTLIYKNGQKTTVAQTDGVALNNSGTVLLSDYLFGRSYIWDGSLHNIGGLPSPNGIQKYDETGAYDINDAGDIVGTVPEVKAGWRLLLLCAAQVVNGPPWARWEMDIAKRTASITRTRSSV
jgi:hypothetical protein